MPILTMVDLSIFSCSCCNSCKIAGQTENNEMRFGGSDIIYARDRKYPKSIFSSFLSIFNVMTTRVVGSFVRIFYLIHCVHAQKRDLHASLIICKSSSTHFSPYANLITVNALVMMFSNHKKLDMTKMHCHNGSETPIFSAEYLHNSKITV